MTAIPKPRILSVQHEDVLHSCAQLLLEKEKITREEFEASFRIGKGFRGSFVELVVLYKPIL